MNSINNIGQLNQLIDNTYIYAVIVVIFAVALSVFIAWLVPWKANRGEDKSYVIRRIWYIVILLFSVFGFWLYNDLSVAPNIENAGWRNMFEACNGKCMLITILGNIVISLIVMFAFKKSKFASIIFKIKSN